VIGRTLGDPFVLGRAHYDLGIALEHGGDLEGAESNYAATVPLLRGAGSTNLAAEALADLGDARLRSGDLAGAISLLDEALTLVREVDWTWGLAKVLGHRGHTALADGDCALAVRLFADSIAAGSEIGAGRIVLGALAGLGGVALTIGQPERAARLLGAVDAARQANDGGRIAHALSAERFAEEARIELGATAFDRAWLAGRALPMEQAIAEALEISAPPVPTVVPLTPREVQIIRLLVAGKSDRAIAEELFVSVRTIEHHVGRIFGKLGVRTRTAAVTTAVGAGLVDLVPTTESGQGNAARKSSFQ
jgi:DNA-binding CsgD family transcriptional regulator